MKIGQLAKLIFFILLVEIIGSIGAVFTTPAIPTWYKFLNKPSFTPPNWLFGPPWTILYLLIGASLYLIWTSKKSKTKLLALKLFFLQLAANVVWSLVFFGLKNPLLGLMTILVLIILITYLIKVLLRLNKKAAYLLTPYLLWVIYATLLNIAIVRLN